MTKVVMISSNDWANSGKKYSEAINESIDDIHVEYFAGVQHPFGYDRGENVITNPDGSLNVPILHKLNDSAREADIIHIKGDEGIPTNIGGAVIPTQNKPTVVTYCGSHYRINKEEYWHRDKDLVNYVTVTTRDLVSGFVDVEQRCIKVPVRIPSLKLINTVNPHLITIGHFPSDYKKKNTKEVFELAERLKNEYGDKVNFLITEQRLKHDQMMSLYSSCDIYIDKLMGYGHASGAAEAMSYGCVVPLVEEYCDEDYMIPISVDSAYTVLSNLIDNPSLIVAHKKNSWKYVNKHHSYKEVASQLAGVYRSLV